MGFTTIFRFRRRETLRLYIVKYILNPSDYQFYQLYDFDNSLLVNYFNQEIYEKINRDLTVLIAVFIEFLTILETKNFSEKVLNHLRLMKVDFYSFYLIILGGGAHRHKFLSYFHEGFNQGLFYKDQNFVLNFNFSNLLDSLINYINFDLIEGDTSFCLYSNDFDIPEEKLNLIEFPLLKFPSRETKKF